MTGAIAFLLISLAATSGFDLDPHLESEVDIVKINCTSEECVNTYVSGFLVRLVAVIDDNQISTYLSNLILKEPTKLNITTNDILELYGINNINFTQTMQILKYLNVTPSTVFSMEGLEVFLNEFDINFATFYSNLVTELDIDPDVQVHFLTLLNINSYEFAYHMQFGNVLAELQKYNITNETFVNAVESIGKTTEMFTYFRNQFIYNISMNSPEENYIILQKYGIHESKLVNSWNVLNISYLRPYELNVFNNILRKVESETNEYTPSAILTAKNQLTTHKAALELFQGKPITINVKINNTIVPVTEISNTSWPNIATLSLNNTELFSDRSYALLATNMTGLQNCTLFFVDGILRNESIPYVKNEGGLLKFNLTIFQDYVPLGSPLVCFNAVYGLVRSSYSGEVILEAFGNLQIPETNTMANDDKLPSSSATNTLCSTLLVVIAMFKFLLFHHM